jgi:hypothetical protein
MNKENVINMHKGVLLAIKKGGIMSFAENG